MSIGTLTRISVIIHNVKYSSSIMSFQHFHSEMVSDIILEIIHLSVCGNKPIIAEF